jgi:hypothetical protein
MVSNTFRRIALAQGLLREPPPAPREDETRDTVPPEPRGTERALDPAQP